MATCPIWQNAIPLPISTGWFKAELAGAVPRASPVCLKGQFSVVRSAMTAVAAAAMVAATAMVVAHIVVGAINAIVIAQVMACAVNAIVVAKVMACAVNTVVVAQIMARAMTAMAATKTIIICQELAGIDRGRTARLAVNKEGLRLACQISRHQP